MREPKKRNKLAVDWSDGIPAELLSLIAENIDSFATCIAFAAVCRSWYNVIASHHITASTPWLMLSEKQNSASRSFFRFGMPSQKQKQVSASRSFYKFGSSSNNNQVFDIELPLEIKGRRCWGSKFGWLITYDSNNNDMNLYNPLSRASIPLPKLFPYFAKKYGGYTSTLDFVRRPRFLEKTILIASPDSPDCMVLVIPTMNVVDDLLYAKPRDIVWSVIDDANLADVLSFHGRLYGCKCETGNIVTLEFETDYFSDQFLSLKEFADAPPQLIYRKDEIEHEYFRKKYLLDLQGEFYLVLRYVKPAGYNRYLSDIDNIDNYYLTYDFEIYKMDLSTKVWKLVESLGDHCLFVGTNNAFAFSVSSGDYLEHGISLRPNCIYFLDDKAFDKQSDGSDIGVFHVGERHFGARPLGENVGLMFENGYAGLHHRPQPFMLKTLASGLYSHSCPPLWITPYLQFDHKPIYKDHHQIEAKDKKLSIIKVEVPFTKMTPDVEDEQIHKLIIQLKNQFTYTEKRGVNRMPWRQPS